MKQTCPVQLVIHWKKNGNWVDEKKKKKSGQICANIYSSFTDLHYSSKNKII